MTGKIAIYLRLSKEDDLIRDESNSITNQRDLIMNFIRKDKELQNMEVVEYTDDGFTGKNMERPGMEALLESIRRRSISVLIVKDMSRFSRDYLVLGKYTEQIFPFMSWGSVLSLSMTSMTATVMREESGKSMSLSKQCSMISTARICRRR